jgi:prepilin-type N-terminal cleavage/methylation domain-containing protein
MRYSNKGVTLVELLAVLVIIGILAAISVPVIGSLIGNTKTKADQAIVYSLNEATRLYTMGESISSTDVFFGFDNDGDRITTLFTNGYLSKMPQPSDSNISFSWDVENQNWILVTIDLPVEPDAPDYDFSVDRLFEALNDGISIAAGSFIDTGTALKSDLGILYIPNPYIDYTIVMNAQITESSAYGGFGLLFDSVVSDLKKESDTGFIVQLDRGYSGGEIIIRPRLNGKEQNPVFRFGVTFNSSGAFVTNGGTKNNQNPWWMQPHELKIIVESYTDSINNKRVSVFIDQIYLFQYAYVSSITSAESNDNYSGLRTWVNIDVNFYSFSIKKNS